MSSPTARAQRVLSYLAEVRPGAVLSGRYRIERELGAGGMGAVHVARHLELGTKLAVKVLLPELLDDAQAISRFAREARAAAQITNEHVARTIDVGRLDCGAPYLVMEFLEGQDGADYLEERGWLSVEHAFDVAIQICTAVSAAHARGIIHRDLKPSNLFFVPRPGSKPLVKVLDFGISKIVSDNDAQGSLTTKSGRMFGSPAYASREQWRDAKNVDRRSDVWAFGVVVYEFLTGQLPFAAESAAMIAINVAAETPRPLRDLRGDIPADLEQIVLRCLEKNPDRRFDDIDELAQALRGCQSRFAVGARRGEQRVGWSATTTLPAAPSWWWIRSKALVRWFAAAMLLSLGWFSVPSYLKRPIRQPSSEEPAHFEPPQVDVPLPATPSV